MLWINAKAKKCIEKNKKKIEIMKYYIIMH